MTGTAKQIAWAEQIKDEALRNCQNMINLDHQRATEYADRNSESNEAAAKIMYRILTVIFSKHDDAAWIIDHRGALSMSGWNGQVSRWAEMIRRGEKTAEQIAQQNGLK